MTDPMADSGLENPDAPVSPPTPARVEPLAEGVYALITGGDPNTGFIVGERGVLVVDARATPALAHETVEAIRRVTDKPILYLVLTHYHAVRVLGASGIGAQHIVAHRATYDLINERGQQDFESEARRFPRLFLDISSVPGLTHPDICYDGSLSLDLGKRKVQLSWLGRGHTEGDTAVWLPDEGVLFAGDLVEDSAAPYCGDAFIQDWIGTLEAVRALGAQSVVPGRGPAVQGEGVNKAINETQRYLRMLRDTVREAVRREASVAQAYQDAEAALTPHFGDWAIFRHCLPFNVQRMYDELSGTRPRIWTASRDAALWRALATQQANKPEYEIG
jgi:glyoxylase-like metal-dependent hydrolase (beta-lactamase superfamily II)